jgi:hypothetical protein
MAGELKMSNLSYCRFQNTLGDLTDCEEHINDELSKNEENERVDLIQCCIKLLEATGSYKVINKEN